MLHVLTESSPSGIEKSMFMRYLIGGLVRLGDSLEFGQPWEAEDELGRLPEASRASCILLCRLCSLIIQEGG